MVFLKGEKNKKNKILAYLKDNLLSLILLFVVILRLADIYTINRVSGESMYPTLTNGQFVFGSNVDILTSNLERGDIMVVKTEDKLIVKRIIGMPGDTIKIHNNVVYINGNKLDEDYVLWQLYPEGDMEPVVLGEDEYFVMGDNRVNSLDSRATGPVSKKQFISKILLY